jgi:hypothetical protein
MRIVGYCILCIEYVRVIFAGFKDQFVPHTKIVISNTMDCRCQYYRDFCLVGSAECCMEFSVFEQIANCSYQRAVIRKRCSDVSLRCGVCWLWSLKNGQYENLILGL